MTKSLFTLIILFGVLSFTSLRAQVGFKLPSFTGTTTGQNLEMPVTVVNFDTVFSIQFVIRWDPTVLEFTNIGLQSNPLFLVDTLRFNTNQADQGIIRFSWFNASAPKTFADGTEIFRLKMKVVGANGTQSPVYFTEILPATSFEVVRGPGNQFYDLETALLTNGNVVVGTISATEEDLPLTQLSVFPNPATDITNVRFELTESTSLHLRCFDLLGRLCYEKMADYTAGHYQIPVPVSELGYPGTYILQLSDGRGAATRILMAH